MINSYEERTYRKEWLKTHNDLIGFEVCYKESDLLILAEKGLKNEALASLLKYRKQLEDYISQNKGFASSFIPLAIDKRVPDIINEMLLSAKEANVGPMAAVAGAIAEFVGRDLLKYSNQIIVENGGDIFIHTQKARQIGIFAGNSLLSGRIGIEIGISDWGVCTSSGTIGHSISFGKADACCVVSKSAVLSDAFATGIGNLIKTSADIHKGIEVAKNKQGILGVVIIKDEQMGVWGKIKLIQL